MGAKVYHLRNRLTYFVISQSKSNGIKLHKSLIKLKVPLSILSMKIIRDSTNFVSEISQNFLYKLSPLSFAKANRNVPRLLLLFLKKSKQKTMINTTHSHHFFLFLPLKIALLFSLHQI